MSVILFYVEVTSESPLSIVVEPLSGSNEGYRLGKK